MPAIVFILCYVEHIVMQSWIKHHRVESNRGRCSKDTEIV